MDMQRSISYEALWNMMMDEVEKRMGSLDVLDDGAVTNYMTYAAEYIDHDMKAMKAGKADNYSLQMRERDLTAKAMLLRVREGAKINPEVKEALDEGAYKFMWLSLAALANK